MTTDVRVGECYHNTDAQFIVWQVTRLTNEPDNIPHARLVRVGDPTHVKLLSTLSLLDKSLFRRLP